MQAFQDLYHNVSFEQAKTLLLSDEFINKSALIRPLQKSPSRFAIVKRFQDGTVNEFSFCQQKKMENLSYRGTSCSLDLSYRVTFYSAKSLRAYVESLSLRERLPRSQEELACYIDTLFAEELGLLLFHGSYVEAHSYLTTTNKSLIVRPNPRDPLSFFVHKKFANNACRSFVFTVSRSKSQASCSGFKVQGQAVLRYHRRTLTFYSAQSLQAYLEYAKTRGYLSKDEEELAAGVDTLYCKHVADVGGAKHAILKPVHQSHSAVSIARKNEAGQEYTSLFRVKKNQSGIILTGPAGPVASSGTLTLCSISAARSYLACVANSLPKEKVSRVFSQSEIELILALNSLVTERRKLQVDECDSAVGSPVSAPTN